MVSNFCEMGQKFLMKFRLMDLLVENEADDSGRGGLGFESSEIGFAIFNSKLYSFTQLRESFSENLLFCFVLSQHLEDKVMN